jgi:hypothetical protein
MTRHDEIWIPLRDKPQKWWRIVCTYDGEPGSIAAAVGSTADEAKTAFLESLAEPNLAVIEEISPIGFCEVTDVIEGLWE